MTDLSKLAAARCAELANGQTNLNWGADQFTNKHGTSDMIAFRAYVEQAHTLATQALAHPDRAAEILAPLILVEPVDADLLIAREAAALVYEECGGIAEARSFRLGVNDAGRVVRSNLRAIRLYRQREGGGNG